jgi:SatD family (SatD)
MKIIVMADIIGSSKRHGKALMNDFVTMVAHLNKTNKKEILSPFTITLGDEFQGVVKNPFSAIQVLFEIEKYLLTLKRPFKMRYVIHEGEIHTKLNKQRAYEMLGPGLTIARKTLSQMKTAKRRFNISLKDEDMTERLNLMFVILQGIVDHWTLSQAKIVSAFLELDDYREVADKLRKDPTNVWRRKGSLMIEEFNCLKKLMYKTTNPLWKE